MFWIAKPYNTVLKEAKTSVDFIVIGHRSSHDDVCVTIHVFGQAMHHYISSKFQRALKRKFEITDPK